MDTANKVLSKRLHKILDIIGASENTRKMHWACAMSREIPLTFESHFDAFHAKASTKRSFYIVGSTCEGTTTHGLHSDVDMIVCHEDDPVVENLVDSRQQRYCYLMLNDNTKPGYVRLQNAINQSPLLVGMCDVSKETLIVDNLDESNHQEKSYIMVTDDNKPGYVRLQRDNDKCPLFGMYDVSEFNRYNIDRKGRICMKHVKLTDGPNTSRNGPADTVPAVNSFPQQDLVYALRCRQIPRSANSWIHRKREYDLPSQKELKAMGSYGCFLVGVEHPHSDNKPIEWRISFSFQERDLMSNLTETQHKCYILLKMIKQNIIEERIGESISSYHLKTSLFHTIESTQRHIWNDGNLIMCVRLCLMRLLIWVKAKNCPNYFIPEENMFDKLSQSTLNIIESVLKYIICTFINCLYSLTSDNVGELLKSKVCCSELVCGLGNTSTMLKVLPVYRLYIEETVCVYRARNKFLQNIHMSSNTFASYMNWTKQLLFYLQTMIEVTEHTTRDVRIALDSVIPHIQLQYQQCKFADDLSRGDMSRLRSKTIPNVMSETSDCDLISSNLSLASLFFRSDQFEGECKRSLMSCENSLEPHVISICACYDRSCKDTIKNVPFTDITCAHFRRNYTTGCIIFHSFNVSLVHKALHYELFRTVYKQPGSNYERMRYYWLNWITVDSQIYLYFLQYLLYSKTERKAEKEAAVEKLKYVLCNDHMLGHKETGLNLLGWICLQENEVPAAWWYFCLSWKERRFNNAAKWHMLILLIANIN